MEKFHYFLYGKEFTLETDQKPLVSIYKKHMVDISPRVQRLIVRSFPYLPFKVVYVVPPQSWGDQSNTKHSKCLLLVGRRLNQLTLIPKPKGSGGARAAMAQVGPANKRNDTKRCLPIEASLRPGEAVPW